MSIDFSLEGKVAIVTGGGSGIGRHIAVTYARAGADVVVCGRRLSQLEDTVEEIRVEGRRGLAIQTDVRRPGEIAAMVRSALTEFGVIDILVCNAGINKTSPTLDVTEETWDAILDTNLKGVFFCCQEVGRHMLPRKSGKIIIISSIQGDWGQGFNVAYCASKGGVNMLTRALALEWAPHGINVNALGPGYVKTEMVKWSLEDPIKGPKIRGKMPMRVGEVEDMEGTAVFLASEASDYVNGRVIYVDGAQAVGWMGPE
jgi:2-deoxy-D-gluconate 3-dehydrogenase